MGVTVAFFCGHQSPYGLSHLKPLVEEFDVKIVILATGERWQHFYQSLNGKVYYSESNRNEFVQVAINWVKTAFRAVRDFLEQNQLRQYLRSKHVEIWEVYDVNTESTVQALKKLNLDLFMSAAYPQIFSKPLLDVPRLGAVNFHPSLLPKYRGAHPHYWQIVNGERQGGITAHFMTEKLDDGDIIAQLSFPIEGLNYSQLYEKIIENTNQLVRDVSKFFREPTSKARPQISKDATYFRNDREIHHRIFWDTYTSQEIDNLVRAGNAFCFFRCKKVQILRAFPVQSNRNLTNDVRVENGTVVDVGKDGVSVKTLDGCINILEFRMKRRNLFYLRWARLVQLSVGERFN